MEERLKVERSNKIADIQNNYTKASKPGIEKF